VVIAVDAQNLVRRGKLIHHLLTSHVFLMLQIVFLAQFNSTQLWLALPLMAVDATHRVFQFLKVNYYCCYVEMVNQLEDGGQDDRIKKPTQETNSDNISVRCFVPSALPSAHAHRQTILCKARISFSPTTCITSIFKPQSLAQECQPECSVLHHEPQREQLLHPVTKHFYHPPPPPCHNSPP
jgi:hypothetical protein